MKRITSVIAALFVAAVFTMSVESCGKYEEGPSFTVKTKKGRLSREWVGESVTDHHTNVTTTLTEADGLISYDKDGKYTVTLGALSFAGEWMFSDDKSKLYSGFDDGTGTIDYDTVTIHRLTSKEFWYVTGDDGHGDEWHLKAK